MVMVAEVAENPAKLVENILKPKTKTMYITQRIHGTGIFSYMNG